MEDVKQTMEPKMSLALNLIVTKASSLEAYLFITVCGTIVSQLYRRSW